MNKKNWNLFLSAIFVDMILVYVNAPLISIALTDLRDIGCFYIYYYQLFNYFFNCVCRHRSQIIRQKVPVVVLS